MTYSDWLKRKSRVLAGGEAGGFTAGVLLTIRGNPKRQSIIIQNDQNATVVIAGYSIAITSTASRQTRAFEMDRYTYGDFVSKGFTFSQATGNAIIIETYIDDEVYKG